MSMIETKVIFALGSTPWPALLPALGPIWYTEKRSIATTTVTHTRPLPSGRRRYQHKENAPLSLCCSTPLRVILPAPSLLRKQHSLPRSLSWLTTTTWQQRRPSISKQAAPNSKKYPRDAQRVVPLQGSDSRSFMVASLASG